MDDEGTSRKTRQNNFEGRKFLEDALRDMGVEFVPSLGQLHPRAGGARPGGFSELQARGIIVRPMEDYGLPEWMRISIGAPRENQRCLKALQKILGKKA